MKLGQYRGFHQWRPGQSYTPVQLTHLDLHKEYNSRLYRAVVAHAGALGKELQIAQPHPRKIINKLLSRHSVELSEVKSVRTAAAKRERSHSEEYASFLRHLYAQKFTPSKLKKALGALPGADRGLQAQYIDGQHLETLISRSMDVPALFAYVFQLVETAQLPLTSRELAMSVYAQAELNSGNWRKTLAKYWSRIVEKHDTGALNQLLKLALKHNCPETQSLVQYHLEDRPNRFTFSIKLVHQPELSIHDVFKQFQQRKFVMDTVVVSTYICGLLKAGRPRSINSAEQIFDQLLTANRGVMPLVGNYNRLVNTLMALDSVNQMTPAQLQLPLYIDTRMFEMMYMHFCRTAQHSRAMDVLEAMAINGHTLPRHLIPTHLRALAAEPELASRLFYLCCDFNMLHPGFFSDTFARVWVSHFVDYEQMSYEEAQNLVSRYRANTT